MKYVIALMLAPLIGFAVGCIYEGVCRLARR